MLTQPNLYIATRLSRLEEKLNAYLPQKDTRLHRALHYMVLESHAKRIRPLLVYATGESLGVSLEKLDAPACAVEFIHAYSLIHDDLPAMDDDTIRRGKPTCHIAFDEATAILAGDALQTLAFERLAKSALEHQLPKGLEMILVLAQAAGWQGMVGGQALEIETVKNPSLSWAPEIEHIHQLKTGALIEASLKLGTMAQTFLPSSTSSTLQKIGSSLGLCFQIQDDILDAAEAQSPSKEKSTLNYSTLFSLKSAQDKLDALKFEIRNLIKTLPNGSEPLTIVTEYIFERAN